jgi:hypothetical protein
MTVPVFRPNVLDEHVPGSVPRATGAYPWPGQQPMGAQGQDYVTPEMWSQWIAQQTAALQASSGFERLKLQAQISDAEKARQNSLQIAQLQSDNSRYGVDQQRLTAIEQLKQRDKEFAANHELDVRKFGLSEGELTGVYNGQPTLAARGQQLTEAQLIAQQRSQPNRLFQTMDLEQALGSIRNGRPASIMPMTGVAAVDGLSSDYQGNPYLAGGNGSTGQAPAGGSGERPAPDPRLKAIKGVFDALPPSVTEGLDPTGVAALNAAYHIYNAPLKPGTLETLSPTQKLTLQSASDRLQGVTGLSYDDVLARYRRQGIGQGNVRAA